MLLSIVLILTFSIGIVRIIIQQKVKIRKLFQPKILPIFTSLSFYDEEVENDNWNNSRKREFLNNIGETIQSRIQEKLGLSDS